MKEPKKKNVKVPNKKQNKNNEWPRGHKVVPKHEVLDWMDSRNQNYFSKFHLPR